MYNSRPIAPSPPFPGPEHSVTLERLRRGYEMGDREGRTCGKYLLEREIARGGMGVIWVALDPKLQRRVALKWLHSGQADASRRLEKEATAVARLQHPNVVQIFDYGVDDSSPYIVMELLEGE